MKTGRKNTPVEILEARKSRHAAARKKQADVIAEKKEPRRPSWLTPGAVRVWKEITPILSAMGVLSVADGELIGRYAQTLDDWVSYDKQIRKEGATYITDQGQRCAHPAARLRREAAVVLKEIGDRLGLSPSARAGMHLNLAWMPGQVPAASPITGDDSGPSSKTIDAARFFKDL